VTYNFQSRRASLWLLIPQTTVWRVVHNRLHLHAYKVQIIQALKPDGKPRRFQFAKYIWSKVKSDENFLRRWIFPDEATFYVSWRVNRHNCIIWGSETPHAIREIEWNVGCALLCTEVLGSFLFAGKTVTTMTYLDMLQLHLLPQLEGHQPNVVVFQQDGAPPHWVRVVREFLDMHFPGCWFGRDGLIPWPPHPPDITPLDFFLWGYVTRPLWSTLMNWSSELFLQSKQLHRKCCRTLGGKLDILRAMKGAHVEVV
jgi:hypothetical protein